MSGDFYAEPARRWRSAARWLLPGFLAAVVPLLLAACYSGESDPVRMEYQGREDRAEGDRGSAMVMNHAEGHIPPTIPEGSIPLSHEEMTTMLRSAGWPAEFHSQALAVAGCESGWHPDARGGHGEFGLFQIHPVHSWRFTRIFGVEADPEDPYQNAVVAHRIWEAQGWAPWSCGWAARR